MVKTLERKGISAIILSDKITKYSIPDEKNIDILCEEEEFFYKIKEGKKAQITDDFMIIARIESFIAGYGLDEALLRARCYIEAGCDGIMIGRASLGKPWIIKRIKTFLETGEKLPIVSDEEKLRVLKEHFEMLLKEKGEYTATREIRKFVAWYVKGMPDARRFKEKMCTIETKESFYDIFKM